MYIYTHSLYINIYTIYINNIYNDLCKKQKSKNTFKFSLIVSQERDWLKPYTKAVKTCYLFVKMR